eukprot:CAMPEP_0198565294 /NCGR_PEP_ID=MMETSP1462-20131121/101566_1 /TAXON_ID=1333877 /ORGANISM="Brandtodinium nutriculum, Strain RCC3387" /LENGTH=67 /DNA_ID=CAMNT_0044296281 /DNA_START=44 /DNA_END=243 /DNA_ORIENTATION=-
MKAPAATSTSTTVGSRIAKANSCAGYSSRKAAITEAETFRNRQPTASSWACISWPALAAADPAARKP